MRFNPNKNPLLSWIGERFYYEVAPTVFATLLLVLLRQLHPSITGKEARHWIFDTWQKIALQHLVAADPRQLEQHPEFLEEG